MIDWIINNWSYIVLAFSGIILLFNIILLLYKKIPLDKILKVLSLIPNLINHAEAFFPASKSGELKKEFVKSQFDSLCNFYGISHFKKYIDIDKIIEDYLNTPESK